MSEGDKPTGTMDRRGIFGGTFNPVHTGHLTVARACATALGLHRIHMIPAAEPPHRTTDLAPATDRMRMVDIAIDGDPLLYADPCELQRSGPSFTIDTVTHLQANRDTDWTLILGMDAMLGLDDWHRAEELIRRLPIAALFRPGTDFSSLTGLRCLHGVPFYKLDSWDRTQPLTLTSDDQVRLILVPVPPCPEAATDIRQAVRHHHPAPPGLTPAVRDYILEHQLYA